MNKLKSYTILATLFGFVRDGGKFEIKFRKIGIQESINTKCLWTFLYFDILAPAKQNILTRKTVMSV